MNPKIYKNKGTKMAEKNQDFPEMENYFEKAVEAAAVFSQFDQKQTDAIVRAVYEAAFKNRISLAKLAATETGIGRWEDKVIKNSIASQFVYEDIKNMKTVGVISDDPVTGITEIAQPMGPVLAIIPVTNPTSTVIFKILICLKSRNPIIISPSKKARKCSCEAAHICYEAALKADAPENCIQWISDSSREMTQAMMAHKKLALILATGGTGLVKSAYSSGTPTLGVGAGNVPVFIEKSADIPFAVEQICASKLFDNGTICASEQAVVADKCVAANVRKEFIKRNAYFLSREETALLEQTAFKGLMNPEIVGRPAVEIAEKAGIKVPSDTKLLMAELDGVGDEYPLSSEVLAPILAYYVADGFDHAVNICIDLNYHGGIGHTASIFSNDNDVILKFSTLMNAGRIVVNTPSSQGAVGGIFNMLNPSLTLGCGTGGKNITTDNVTAKHLINIQRIARRRENQRFNKIDMKIYFDESVGPAEAEKLYNHNF
jgi:acetaldehyde dehydrogenase/alcohol dehydrogenase